MKNYISCQCPKRATLISTWWKNVILPIKTGVNALSGLLSFLLLARNSCVFGLITVCQCPKRATLISTRYRRWCSVAREVCQCPKRATLISTVPSENPCKHWLSSLIFAGICQNILITSVFPPFFGLFTICSYLSLPSLLSIKKNYTSLPTKIKAFFHTNVMLS